MSTESKPIEWCLLWSGPCLQSSEWASWAQALFSALAVFAAIGVVWWQLRVARNGALAAAELAASGILAGIDQTIAGLQSAAQDLQSRIDGADTTSSRPQQIAAILGTLQLPSREDLLALSAASKECAILLLRVNNATNQIKTALDLVSTVPLGLDANGLADLLRPLQQLAVDAATNLQAARVVLDELSPG